MNRGSHMSVGLQPRLGPGDTSEQGQPHIHGTTAALQPHPHSALGQRSGRAQEPGSASETALLACSSFHGSGSVSPAPENLRRGSKGQAVEGGGGRLGRAPVPGASLLTH